MSDQILYGDLSTVIASLNTEHATKDLRITSFLREKKGGGDQYLLTYNFRIRPGGITPLTSYEGIEDNFTDYRLLLDARTATHSVTVVESLVDQSGINVTGIWLTEPLP